MYMLMNSFIFLYTHICLLFIYQYIYLKYNLTLALKPQKLL